ncbi:MAG: DUF5916 domain-containing protein [Paraglaciecola sp.]|uniref:DUF5916 domain-containing protein n=1 Tax=Paraglaciecola sp. TaxID=1920173 RepID=UPI003298221E
MVLKLQLITLLTMSFSVFPVEVMLTTPAAFIKKNYPLHNHKKPPIIDGAIEEPVWQEATIIELKYQNEPIHGAPAPVKTIAYLYQDGTNLHIAIQAFDPEPNRIRASLRDHDNIFKDDNVGIIVDTFNDQRTGFGFFVNPLGAQADMTIKESDDSDDAEDYSWNAIWHSAGQINSAGYSIEMSIPFHALRFPDTTEELIWNIAIQRSYPRENSVEIANYQRDRERKCTICQYESLVGFKDIKAAKNLQLTPTLTLGRADAKAPPYSDEWQQGDVEHELGLDLRWGVNQSMVLNATVNPDFSQVEADAVQLDINSTYALYYDEKRPFFLDGADYFTTPMFNFVHTRNIADPEYGLKLTGKTDAHLYGLMVTDDNRTDFLIPGNQGSVLARSDLHSTASIARYRIDIGEQSNIGALITHREAEGYNNQVISVDGEYWLSNNSSFNYQLAHSESTNPLQIQQDYALEATQSGQAYVLSYNHRTRDLSFFADAEKVTGGFRADLGFQERVDFQSVGLGGSKHWFANEYNWLSAIAMNQFSISGDWDKSWDNDSTLLEDEWEVYAELQGDMQSTIELGAIHRNSLYQGVYYQENQMTFWGEFTPLAELTLSSFIRFGDQIDFTNEQLGQLFKISNAVYWQINQYLQFEVEYEYTHLDVNRKQLYKTNVLATKLIWQFNRQSQLQFILQDTDINRDLSLYRPGEYSSSGDQSLATQLLFSYKLNPQTLFYLGYSDNGFADDQQDFIRTERSLFAKFSYAI